MKLATILNVISIIMLGLTMWVVIDRLNELEVKQEKIITTIEEYQKTSDSLNLNKMNLRKFFHISKDKTVESEDVEHWVVEWRVYTGWAQETKLHTKVFIDRTKAINFVDALKAARDLTDAYVRINLKKQ